MNGYIAFTQKELLAIFRSGRLLVFTIIFLLLGLMNPLIAKFTPEILKNFPMDGIALTIPEPTALDSWTQYYKNVTQFGLIVLVIFFSGILANELTKGTLINMVTKGLSRKTAIFAKLSASVLLWTCGNLLSFFTTYFYTLFYWPNAQLSHLFLAASFLWLFGLVLLGSIFLGSVLFSSMSGSLLFCGGCVIILFLLNIFPNLTSANPLYLASNNLQLLNNQLNLSDFLPASVTALLWLITSLGLSIVLFNKKAL